MEKKGYVRIIDRITSYNVCYTKLLRLVLDDTHMLTVIEIEGSSTDQQKEDIINNIEISVEEAEFPPGYKMIISYNFV